MKSAIALTVLSSMAIFTSLWFKKQVVKHPRIIRHTSYTHNSNNGDLVEAHTKKVSFEIPNGALSELIKERSF